MSNTLSIEGYDDVTRIGGGGFSVIYKATDTRHSRTVAIKVLDLEKLDDRVKRAFTRECQTMGRVSQHPNIVTLFDSGFAEGGVPYLVMPFYEGGSCGDLVKASGPMSVADVLETGVEIASALESAHQANVVHRDVKPDNIFIDRYDRRVLGDFGISAFSGVDRSNETTTSGLSFTPAHASPEVLNEKDPGPASDLYSLGSTLYTLLTGSNPFHAASMGSLIMKVLNDPPQPIERTDIPSSLHEIINDLLRKDPSTRPQSAAEVARRLQQTQADAGLRLSEIVIENEAPYPSIDLRDTPEVREVPAVDRTHVPESVPDVVEVGEPTPPGVLDQDRTNLITGPARPGASVAAPVAAPSEQFQVEPTSPKRAIIAALSTLAFLVVGGFVVWTAVQSPEDIGDERETPTDFQADDDDVQIIQALPQVPLDVAAEELTSSTVRFTWEDGEVEGTTWQVRRSDRAEDLGRVEEPRIDLPGLLATERPCIEVRSNVDGVWSAWSATACRS